MTRLRDYVGMHELLINLTLRELRGRYRRSMLGWTWSLLHPLANVLIYTLVFSFFLKIQPPTGNPSGLHAFALFLLCGLVSWNLFAIGIIGGQGSLIVNGNLIKKVYFPRELLVTSTIFAVVITALIEFGVLLVVLIPFGNIAIQWIPILLVVVALQTIFVLGIALAFSVWNVYLRDLEYLTTILMNLLFYLTPIVYPIRYVPQTAHIFGRKIPARAIYDLNPMVHFVGAYRNLLYDLRFPPIGSLLYLAAWSAGTLLFGYYMFKKFESRLAEEV
jgi:ABC-type polysaccharide/polyol phosphate export permease